MSARQSAAALKRWQRPIERRRMSRLMKSRFQPKLTVGKTPDLRRELPPPVAGLLDALGDEMLEVVECSPLRVSKPKRNVWRIALLDGSDIALGERYFHLVTGHGLHLYQISSRPLRSLGGVCVVLFVGLP